MTPSCQEKIFLVLVYISGVILCLKMFYNWVKNWNPLLYDNTFKPEVIRLMSFVSVFSWLGVVIMIIIKKNDK